MPVEVTKPQVLISGTDIYLISEALKIAEQKIREDREKHFRGLVDNNLIAGRTPERIVEIEKAVKRYLDN